MVVGLHALNAAAAQGQAEVQAQAESMGRALFAGQINERMSDTQFVTNLYEGFLQRGPDTGGLTFWTQVSIGQSRQHVLDNFATCGPFRELAGTLYREVDWLVADHLGTPRMVLNKTGSLASVRRHDYLPFGEEFGGPLISLLGGRTTGQGYIGDNVRQKFTSKERDVETGLDYFNARYYGTSQGRFTSIDPLVATGRPSQPQSWNRYAYVLNNPSRLVDPDGKADVPAQIVDVGKDKIINNKIDDIQKSAKPLDKGVTPVPTKAVTIPGEKTVLNNATVIAPDGQKVAAGVNGYMQPVALVVLDQGGNIMKSPDMYTVENAKADNAAAQQIVDANQQKTSNAIEIGQTNNGAFYDYQIRGTGAKPLDIRTSQDVTIRQYSGPSAAADYKDTFQITGNKIRFDDVKKQVTFTPGTTKKL